VGVSEAAIQQEIRLAAGQGGSVLFRNNQGAYQDASGRLIRYGVCNPGGSDLIGWTPVTVTQDMVGRTVAVFTAVEVKSQRGTASKPQVNFIDAVTKAGGFAGIARSVGDYLAIVRGY
jgi:hypothetical protein